MHVLAGLATGFAFFMDALMNVVFGVPTPTLDLTPVPQIEAPLHKDAPATSSPKSEVPRTPKKTLAPVPAVPAPKTSTSPKAATVAPVPPVTPVHDTVIADQNNQYNIRITSPTEGAELYEDSTTTIAYQIEGLPADIAGAGYRFTLQFGDATLQPSTGYVFFSKTNNFQGSSFSWHLPHLMEQIGPVGSEVHYIQAELTQDQQVPYTDAEKQELVTRYKIDPQKIPAAHVVSKVLTRVSRPVQVYRTTQGLLGSRYYMQSGTAVLGVGNVFDVWGGRFMMQLESLSGGTAHFKTWFTGGGPAGSVAVTLGKSVPFTITGTDTFGNGSNAYAYTGRMTLKRVFGPNLGEFAIAMDTESPVETAASRTSVDVYSKAKVTVTQGLATLTAQQSAPYVATIAGSYNVPGLCTEGVQYYLSYGDGASEILVSNSCTVKPYSKTHTYVPGVYSAEIHLYQAEPGGWTHYVQASVLITVSNTGALTFKIIDPGSGVKG